MALKKMVLIKKVKVTQSQNGFFKADYSSKKTHKWIRLYYNDASGSGWIVSTLFLEEIEDTKNTSKSIDL